MKDETQGQRHRVLSHTVKQAASASCSVNFTSLEPRRNDVGQALHWIFHLDLNFITQVENVELKVFPKL